MSDQGEYSYKMTGLSYTANANDEVTTSSDWEGTATGFGAVFGTLKATMPLTDANAASGACTFVGPLCLQSVKAPGSGLPANTNGRLRWL